jgi:hypothetical protein
MFSFRSNKGMDNRLNEIRKQIIDLRTKIAELESQMRLQISQDAECSDVCFRLIARRQELVALISRRDALGGGETCPTIAERLASNRRPTVVGKRVGR